MDIFTRYKQILESGAYGRVAYRNLRGIVTDSDIRFYDLDDNIVGLIDPSKDNLYGVFDDRFFDIIGEAVHDIASDPDEYLS